MDLKEFVKESLVQITEGVKEAQEECNKLGGLVNPMLNVKTCNDEVYKHDRKDYPATKVSFNVALSEVNNKGDKTGIGVFLGKVSMYDKHMPGDTIFIREIQDKDLIDNGQPYVVITNEDRLFKLIYIEKTGLKLVSYNPICNPDGRRKYPDMEIDGNQILHLYKVVGKLARTQM